MCHGHERPTLLGMGCYKSPHGSRLVLCSIHEGRGRKRQLFTLSGRVSLSSKTCCQAPIDIVTELSKMVKNIQGYASSHICKSFLFCHALV